MVRGSLGCGRMVAVGWSRWESFWEWNDLQRPLVWGGRGGRTRTILRDQRLRISAPHGAFSWGVRVLFGPGRFGR